MVFDLERKEVAATLYANCTVNQYVVLRLLLLLLGLIKGELLLLGGKTDVRRFTQCLGDKCTRVLRPSYGT